MRSLCYVFCHQLYLAAMLLLTESAMFDGSQLAWHTNVSNAALLGHTSEQMSLIAMSHFNIPAAVLPVCVVLP